MLTNRILIGGDFKESASAGTMDHFYPATGEKNGVVSLGGAEEINQAVTIASSAARKWQAVPSSERGKLLLRLAEIIEAWRDDFRALSTAETGMPIRGFDSRHTATVHWLRYYAGFADKIGGDLTATSNEGRLELTRLEPYGVIGIIITWNIPLLSLAMKVPAALIAGNSVVIKPSELTPYTPELFGRACLEAGIPPGVVNVVPGDRAAGEALVAHPDVAKISFTGGTGTASAMMRSGSSLIKPFCFELGGKSARIIFGDADLALAADVIASQLSNAGQTCRLGSRLFVHESALEEFKSALEARLDKVVVGDPEDPLTSMGPLITAQSLGRIRSLIDAEANSGASKLFYGGDSPTLPDRFKSGNFIRPTIFEDISPSSRISQEEIFGPLLTLSKFSSEDDVINSANSTQFGLANHVHTKDLARAIRVTSQLKSGMVFVNDADLRNPAAPFGGWGMSGMGYEGGRAGLDEYLRKKTIGLA